MVSTPCEFCEHLSIEHLLRVLCRNSISNMNHYDLEYRSYPHQPSLGALKQSAENGCGFCQFIMDSLDRTQPGQDAKKPNNAQIYLGLISDTVWENREIVHGIGIVKHLAIRLSPETFGYRNRCTFELITPSALIMSINGKFRIGKPELDPNIASSSTFNIARQWLNECRHSHSDCLRDCLPALPTRVIDVGTTESPTEPRLIIANGLRGDYVALSHCWGGNIATSLVTNTLSMFQSSLPYTELPRNFRDAITITRELDVRYLWIDSVCILQDSKQDWTAESARMGSVYRDATVTISAMVPANSNLGILNPYLPPHRLAHKLRVYETENQLDEVTAELVDPTHERMEKMEDLWENSPLTSRGWTLQEFVLSPRHLFYGRRQIYWKCPEGFKAADGDIHNSLRIQHEEVSRILHRDRLSTMPSPMPDLKRLLFSYYALVQEYCKRELTNSSDKLPAFSGIASGLQPVLGGDYLAGIWTCDLTHGLLWRGGHTWRKPVTPSISRKDSRAPSWSWAAARGIIKYDHLDLPTTSWQIRRVGHDIVPLDRANPFGQVQSARIVVEGFTIPLIPTSSDADSSRLVKAAQVELTQWDSQDTIYLFHPLLAIKLPEISPSLAATPHNSKEQPLDGAKMWSTIDQHWNRNKALPIEIEDRLGDQVLVDSPDFKKDGLCALLIHAETQDRRYWAEGNPLFLMLRPVPSESGDAYERVGYVQFWRVRIKWLNALKTRIVTLV